MQARVAQLSPALTFFLRCDTSRQCGGVVQMITTATKHSQAATIQEKAFPSHLQPIATASLTPTLPLLAQHSLCNPTCTHTFRVQDLGSPCYMLHTAGHSVMIQGVIAFVRLHLHCPFRIFLHFSFTTRFSSSFVMFYYVLVLPLALLQGSFHYHSAGFSHFRVSMHWGRPLTASQSEPHPQRSGGSARCQ